VTGWKNDYVKVVLVRFCSSMVKIIGWCETYIATIQPSVLKNVWGLGNVPCIKIGTQKMKLKKEGKPGLCICERPRLVCKCVLGIPYLKSAN
jgi:hypothetical protein